MFNVLPVKEPIPRQNITIHESQCYRNSPKKKDNIATVNFPFVESRINVSISEDSSDTVERVRSNMYRFKIQTSRHYMLTHPSIIPAYPY